MSPSKSGDVFAARSSISHVRVTSIRDPKFSIVANALLSEIIKTHFYARRIRLLGSIRQFYLPSTALSTARTKPRLVCFIATYNASIKHTTCVFLS